jgi:WD40 repeat protein
MPRLLAQRLGAPFTIVALLGCSSAPMPAPDASPPPIAPAPSSCDEAAALRGRVPALREAGRLGRALRILDKADRLCPESAAATRGARLETLIDLGRHDVARALAAQAPGAPESTAATTRLAALAVAPTDEAKAARRARLDEAIAAARAGDHRAARDSFLAVWAAAHPDGEALVEAGIEAGALGEKAEAQRLLDRGLDELERAAGKRATLDREGAVPAGVARWSADGKSLLLGGEHAVYVADAGTLRIRRRLPGPDATGTALAIAAADTVVTGGVSPRRWSLLTGEVVATFTTGAEAAGNLVASPDGARLAVANGNAIRVFDAADGKLLGTWEEGIDQARGLAFSRDGKRLYSCADGPHGNIHAHAVDAASLKRGDKARTWTFDHLPGASYEAHGACPALDVSPDGRLLAVACSSDAVCLFDTGTSALLHTVGGLDEIASVAFAPDGKEVAVGSEAGAITFLDARHGKVLRSGKVGHAVASVAYSPDGARLAVGGGGVTILRSSDATPAVGGEHVAHPPIERVALAGDTLAMVAALDGGAGVAALALRAGALRKLGIAEGFAGALAIAPDGARVAHCPAGGHPCDVWDLQRGAHVDTGKGLEPGNGLAAAFWPDAASLVVGRTDHVLLRFDPATGGLLKTQPADAAAGKSFLTTALAFSPDGHTVAYCASRALFLWDSASAQPPRKLDAKRCSAALAFSPDGRTLAVARENERFAYLAEVPSGAALRDTSPLVAEDGAIALTSLAFSPDGKTLASSAGRWDVATGAGVKAGAGAVSVAYAPSGRVLAGAGGGALRLTAMPEGRLLVTLRASGDAAALAIDPEDRVELLGEGPQDRPLCHVGPVAFPFEACAERLLAPGMMAEILAGTAAYLEP